MAMLFRTLCVVQRRNCIIEINQLKYRYFPPKKYLSSLKTVNICSSIRHLSIKNNDKYSSETQVYTGILTRKIRNIKLFSLCTSILGLIAQPVIYQKMSQTNSLGTLIGISVFFGFFAIASPLLLNIITKKYITRIRYSALEDKYIATSYTMFLREKQIAFQPKDVLVPQIPGMFTSCLIKNTPVFISPEAFDDINHYKRIMGYDKPLNLNVSVPEDSSTVKMSETSK